MCTIYRKTKEIREQLEPIVGITKAKTFFSYYAIFKNNLLFGLYKDEKLYLRMPESISIEDEFLQSLERLEDHKFGIHCKNFYHIPSTLLSEHSRLSRLVQLTLKEISHQKIRATIKRKNLIRSLPNLNINIERTLKRLGIHSINEFIEKGAFAIYVELIKRGIDADHILLFKLYGAANKQYIYTMSPDLKKLILKDANQALYDAGLRKRFKINED